MSNRQGLLLIAGVWIMFGLVNYPVLQDVVVYGFDDGTYSHSFLIPFVCLFLIWDTARNREFAFRSSIGFLIAALIASVFLSTAYVAQIAPIFRILLPLALTLYLLAIYRPSLASIIAPLMLLFMVPVWGILAAPLQILSVTAVTAIMSVTPIPTFVQGNLITIPAGTFEIAGGCSGLRYFIVSLAIGILYCHLNFRDSRSWLFFLGLAIAGSLLVNWIRIVGLIVVGHVTSMQSSLVEDHNQFGWYIFVPFLLLLFVAGRSLQAKELLREKSSKPRPDKTVTEDRRVGTVFLVALLAGIALTSTVLFANLSTNPDDEENVASLLNWSGPVPSIPNPSSISVAGPQFSSAELPALEYRFFGHQHDNKATYFRNNFIPENWRVAERKASGSHNFVIVSSPSGDWGLVRFGYGPSDKSTSSRLRYRLQRLLNAFQLNAESVLNWSFVECANLDDCTALRERL